MQRIHGTHRTHSTQRTCETKKLKLFFSSILFCIFSLFFSLASAHTVEQLLTDPYIGIDIIKTTSGFKSDFANRTFPKKFTTFTLFTGAKFSEHFGYEFGLGGREKGDDLQRLHQGDLAPRGGVLQAGDILSFENTYRSKHVYLGIFGESKLFFEDLRLRALVAASFTNIKADQRLLSSPYSYGGGFYFSHIEPSMRKSYSESKAVPMLKLTILYALHKNINVGVDGSWRKLSKFVLRDRSTHPEIRLKDAYSLGLSIIFNLV